MDEGTELYQQGWDSGVAYERERCAKIAEGAQNALLDAETCMQIAAAIRNQK